MVYGGELLMSLAVVFGFMHLARLKFMVYYVLGLVISKSVSSNDIASSMMTSARYASNKRRIERFFGSGKLSFDVFSKGFIELSGLKGPFILSMDRTNWKIGKVNINILMLSICTNRKTAIPVLVRLLNHQGNSTQELRIELMNKFIELFGIDNILYVTGDREFIGKKWITYLVKNNIGFHIRIPKNVIIEKLNNGKSIYAWHLFDGKNAHKPYTTKCVYKVYGQKLYLTGLKLPNNDYLIVISNKEPENALKVYEKRWTIECLFKALKTSGFNIENTKMKSLESIEKLLILTTIAFIWAYKVGDWQWMLKPPKTKTVKNKKVPEYNVFTFGLNFLRTVIISKDEKKVELARVSMKVLSGS